MIRVDVRRLAAVDMHGVAGTRLRRWLIVVEFLIGAVGAIPVGLWVLSAFWPLGVWTIGVGLNYVPLALHALSLSRPGRLAAELDGVDIPAELRYYTGRQFWVLVPLLFVVLALRQRRQVP